MSNFKRKGTGGRQHREAVSNINDVDLSLETLQEKDAREVAEVTAMLHEKDDKKTKKIGIKGDIISEEERRDIEKRKNLSNLSATDKYSSEMDRVRIESRQKYVERRVQKQLELES